MADDLGFKFKIGDFCVHKAIGPELAEQAYFVVYRFIDECEGGSQRKYRCRLVSPHGIRDPLIDFSEIELVDAGDAVSLWPDHASLKALRRKIAKEDASDSEKPS